MLHQIERGRAEQQELPCPVSGPSAFVDQTAQGGKELRRAVDLVDDGQPPCRVAQIGCGIIEHAQILAELQIEIYAVGPFGDDRAGQCGLATWRGLRRTVAALSARAWLTNHAQRRKAANKHLAILNSGFRFARCMLVAGAAYRCSAGATKHASRRQRGSLKLP